MIADRVSTSNVEELQYVCIVAERQDAHILELLGQEVSGPEDRCGFVGPGGIPTTCEAMDEHDTEICVNELAYCGGGLLLLYGVVLSFCYRSQTIIAYCQEIPIGRLFFPAS